LKTRVIVAIALLFALMRTGYAAGIDAVLSTQDAVSYRQSLDAAWQGMNDEQRKAYNWAVGNASLKQLAGKYPDMTPRKVIARETDEYIARRTQDLADLTEKLAANADKLAREEAAVREVQKELVKLTLQANGFQKVPDASRREELRFNFTVNNDSRFNVSSVKWDAWLFINDEQTSDQRSGRYCQISLDYKKDGGLSAGKSKNDFITILGATQQCPRWNTLEIQHAQSHTVKVELDAGSVEDFGNRRVLPHFSPVRADYEHSIASAQEDLKVARRLQASLNP